MDVQCEQLLHLCSFLSASCRAASTRQSLHSLAATLETVEQELVPGVLALYLQPGDPGTRVAARILRSLYHRLTEQLASLVTELVDPAAYCVVLAQEAAGLVRGLRLEDREGREGEVLEQLVAMAEAGVDMVWRGLQPLTQPLEESHPLVRAERSGWEVRAGARLLAGGQADYRAALRRAQVLVTALEDLVTFLTEEEEEEGSKLVEGKAEPGGLLSFRASRHLQRTAALAEESRREVYRLLHDRRDVYRLLHDLTPYSPCGGRSFLRGSPPVRASMRASSSARRSSARLDSVLGQLEHLSNSLAGRQGAGEGVREGTSEEAREGTREVARTGGGEIQDISLRRLVLKPNQQYVTSIQV